MLIFCKGGGTEPDYSSGPYSVIFPAGITSATFDVPIENDNILETNELFDLFISSPLPDRIFQANPNQSTVTIVDNDSK